MIRKNLIAIAMLIYGSLMAQNTKEIDRIFEDWNQKNHPGGVVLITKGNATVYSKALGFANVQYNIPTTTTSVFNIASVSKQFTALGIALLMEQGKLNVDDNIKQYLPELPDLATRIKISHLLHHSSGLRSTPELFALAGWREGDAITTDDVYHYLCKQTDLNFEPGEEFVYSNSNYVLLALIIEKVSGEKFSSWMKSNVFEPLGMSDTFVDELNENINSYTCTPYFEKAENTFIRAENTGLEIGASNVYTTAPDLLKWLNQLKSPTKKWEKVIQMMLSTDPLNNGNPNEYASGLFIDKYKGNHRIYHEGGIMGFVSFSIVFPEEELTVIVLCNYLDYRAHQRVDKLLSLLLEDKSARNQSIETIKTTPLNQAIAKAVCGNYWNWNENYPRTIQLENDSLWYVRANGVRSPLFQISDSTYLLGGIKAIVTVRFQHTGTQLDMYVKDGDKPEQLLTHYDGTMPTSAELFSYAGSFYSPELETYYTIQADGEGISGYHNRHGQFEIQPLGKDFVNWSDFAYARYVKDAAGNIQGFYLTTTRVRNVWFKKQSGPTKD